ncbi:hypothetical protein OG819_11515 [Streptomyces sp. NBC_01549]|uniref:hypothetical protein n=1 Tax=Streptomyces sp. NBC_01549 TaxID=2975874 RepID=UPI0022575C96|nr:hypothetical protein [Streptomyces sp. NBC_01549]MCX4590364.1 hypothetical protein [Streptomyces sp. NBC_01549]
MRLKGVDEDTGALAGHVDPTADLRHDLAEPFIARRHVDGEQRLVRRTVAAAPADHALALLEQSACACSGTITASGIRHPASGKETISSDDLTYAWVETIRH